MAVTVTGISPSSMGFSEGGPIIITGTGYDASNFVEVFIGGVAPELVEVISTTEIHAQWIAYDLPSGVYDVRVVDRYSEDTLVASFTIGSGTPPTSDPIVNIGTNPDDGTGDTIRSAFNKINNAFFALGGLPFMRGDDDSPTTDPSDTTKVTLYRGTVNNKVWLWDTVEGAWFPVN